MASARRLRPSCRLLAFCDRVIRSTTHGTIFCRFVEGEARHARTVGFDETLPGDLARACHPILKTCLTSRGREFAAAISSYKVLDRKGMVHQKSYEAPCISVASPKPWPSKTCLNRC